MWRNATLPTASCAIPSKFPDTSATELSNAYNHIKESITLWTFLKIELLNSAFHHNNRQHFMVQTKFELKVKFP